MVIWFDRKEKLKWQGDLKETTGLILSQVSSLKKQVLIYIVYVIESAA